MHKRWAGRLTTKSFFLGNGKTSMSATDIIRVGEPLPRIAHVKPCDGTRVQVVWANRGDSKPVVVDLAPVLFTYRVYRPLRDDRALFETVRATEDGGAIAWGDDDALDMAASTIERLAEERMEPADFAAFLKRHKMTYEAAASQLGISRRLVAYYASERDVPRYIALACAYLNSRLTSRAEMREGRSGGLDQARLRGS
jgi:hypothetical protein